MYITIEKSSTFLFNKLHLIAGACMFKCHLTKHVNIDIKITVSTFIFSRWDFVFDI